MCDLCGPDEAADPTDYSITHPFELKPDTDNDCLVCDEHLSRHPDKMQYLAKLEMENIIRAGHTIRFVFGNPESAPFAYSIGRTVKDRPELLITGALPPETLGYIVNRVAEIDDESPVSAGMELDEVLEGYKVRLVQVADLDEAEMFGVTRHFEMQEHSALQILWPDADGRFPGEEGFAYGDAQPVFS